MLFWYMSTNMIFSADGTLASLNIDFKGGLSGWMTWQFLNALELFSP